MSGIVPMFQHAGVEETRVIRQAISCDICGAEKKQTNHWFVASELAGELRVSGWSSRNRLRAGSKHLCGQTCLHKLLDEFLARTIEGRPAPDAADAVTERRDATDASLTSKAAFVEEESSALVVAPPVPERATPAVLVAMAPRVAEPQRPVVLTPRNSEGGQDAARRRRAEAWERERARELHVMDRRPN